MITIKVTRIEGLNELNATLRELPKSLAKNALTRVLKKRAQPMAEQMRGLAPDDPDTPSTHDLKGSIGVGTKLSKRQARLHRAETKDDKQFAEVFVGAGNRPQAHLNEFGSINNTPHPFVRPVWDQYHDTLIDKLKEDFWAEIKKTADRYAKKMARKG